MDCYSIYYQYLSVLGGIDDNRNVSSLLVYKAGVISASDRI